jgi:hypothetical protein
MQIKRNNSNNSLQIMSILEKQLQDIYESEELSSNEILRKMDQLAEVQLDNIN